MYPLVSREEAVRLYHTSQISKEDLLVYEYLLLARYTYTIDDVINEIIETNHYMKDNVTFLIALQLIG